MNADLAGATRRGNGDPTETPVQPRPIGSRRVTAAAPLPIPGVPPQAPENTMKLKTLFLSMLVAIPALAAGANALAGKDCSCPECACGNACACE
jgi:hypothetical protein